MIPLHSPQDIRIIPYRSELQPAFERLNLGWLKQYDLLEEEDLKYLRNPDRHIVQPGGQVFFALSVEEVVGTCAAIRQNACIFELAKLAVEPNFRRRGLGRLLSETVISFARQSGATQVVLVSNSALKEAILLYESLGFNHTPMPPEIQYRTANVYMTRELGEREIHS